MCHLDGNLAAALSDGLNTALVMFDQQGPEIINSLELNLHKRTKFFIFCSFETCNEVGRNLVKPRLDSSIFLIEEHDEMLNLFEVYNVLCLCNALRFVIC